MAMLDSDVDFFRAIRAILTALPPAGQPGGCSPPPRLPEPYAERRMAGLTLEEFLIEMSDEQRKLLLELMDQALKPTRLRAGGVTSRCRG